MKASAERTDMVMRKIQDLLNRNISFKQHATKHISMQPGFLLTSKQQALDRYVRCIYIRAATKTCDFVAIPSL